MATTDFLSVEVLGQSNLLSNLDQMPAIVRQLLGPKIKYWTEAMADRVRDNIESRLDQRTGKLLAGVKTKITNTKTRVSGMVYIANVPYAEAQEEGAQTPAHEIFPKKGKVLAFMAGSGQKVFATHVHHPGAKIPAEHFMRDAFKELSPKVTKDLKVAIVQGIRAKMRQSA